MRKTQTLNLAIALSLIAMVVILRVLPHPANFAPVAAVAIFGGAILPRRLAIWAPVTAMIVSDVIIGFYNTILVTWACYALIALAASHWLRKPAFRRGLALTVSGSLFFFFVTNFATWLWTDMYAHTWAGLEQCFTMALPFFRGTALGDLIYTGALFGAYYVAIRLSARVFKLPVPKNT
ncbi:MAG TPA: DUF6580 family putative transport protein [Candidatus Saccharimonadales bacterium]|nr:DUF6580 family putative transport protein [Candidatus Saccharimonadales bacterium]